jgi:hypothetical protein
LNNIAKRKFCREVKFLGHCIGRTGVCADPERVEAVQNYPVPRSAEQLRQFLEICNFHSRFIVVYPNCTGSLISLLKQGNKWKWTKVKQETFPKIKRMLCKQHTISSSEQ